MITHHFRYFSGGLPDRQSGVATDVRILLEDEPDGNEPPPKKPRRAWADDPSTNGNKHPLKKPRTSAIQPAVPRPETPLYNHFLANLEREGQGDMFTELADTFVHDNVAYINLDCDRVDRRVQ